MSQRMKDTFDFLVQTREKVEKQKLESLHEARLESICRREYLALAIEDL
jgi:hypothetical protein